MGIKGLNKLSLLDYPEKLAAIIFYGGCNFACPFCHNSSLINNEGPDLSEESVLDFLKSRVGKLEAVCISGGEPLLYNLEEFLIKIKNLGYLIKIDSNGTNPEALIKLVNQGLVDYVAIDIKNSQSRYSLTSGQNNDVVPNINKTISFLLSNSVDYEFRTTIIDSHHRLEDIETIGKWVTGAKRFILQQFRMSEAVIDKNLKAADEKIIFQYQKILNRYVKEVVIKGLP